MFERIPYRRDNLPGRHFAIGPLGSLDARNQLSVFLREELPGFAYRQTVENVHRFGRFPLIFEVHGLRPLS